MIAYDEDGNPIEMKIEYRYRCDNPYLVDGVEVITKKEQDMLEEVRRQMAKQVDERILEMMMRGSPDPEPTKGGYLGVVRDGKDIA